ncbi:16S rRNA (adenine(1518)-N(6)/adenine(1519)-N(6))-dimethyltransferase RsmA [Caldisericum exile]|uniref:Dimethyladenosine transferase n=1 Tax=Caldisericum exile (strain DSM 21853 / NBRC 104410 / AZM16c01) TaxID=511051 RepID=A0A7U6JEK0_CALEA|nr:16S rRNA (adenine(1518)-N(6)/adenine(1519)-N(6))-dimethyltransferase RsmA [Caldisericum exile]BAL80553.1 dimethyladenosine transferase [Caldisericum exile AZM16c01]
MEISREVKLLIDKYNFKASKRLGQNFLVSSSALNFIVEALTPSKDKSYIEVGPGFAFLTKSVAQFSRHIYAIELDKRFEPFYNENPIQNVTFILGDALSIDFNQFDATEIYGNIPYYITSDLIIKVAKSKLKRAVFLVQDEFAKRLISNVSTKEYGSITVFTKFFFEVSFLKRFPPSFFIPRPDVYSSLIELKRIREFNPVYEDFLQFVHRAFTQRRKKLLTTLKASYNFDFSKVFSEIGLTENARAEDVSVDEFFTIYMAFAKQNTKS